MKVLEILGALMFRKERLLILKPWRLKTYVEKVEQAIFLAIFNICVAPLVSKGVSISRRSLEETVLVAPRTLLVIVNRCLCFGSLPAFAILRQKG